MQESLKQRKMRKHFPAVIWLNELIEYELARYLAHLDVSGLIEENMERVKQVHLFINDTDDERANMIFSTKMFWVCRIYECWKSVSCDAVKCSLQTDEEIF